MRRVGILPALCMSLSAALGTPSYAADLAPAWAPSPAGAESGWIITLKGNVSISNDWEGARTYGPQGYPEISFRRANQPAIWDAPDDGFGLSVYDTPYFSVGPVLRYDSGRYRSDDPRSLFGVHDVPWTVEPGAFTDFWPIPNVLRGHLELRHGLNSNGGFVADAGVDYLLHAGQTTFALGPRLGLSDADFMRRQFGVTATDALQNRALTAFKPGGGLRSAGLATSLTHDISHAWSTTVYGGYDRLVADAAKSPLVRKLGSPDQFRAGVTLSYSFGFNGF